MVTEMHKETLYLQTWFKCQGSKVQVTYLKKKENFEKTRKIEQQLISKFNTVYMSRIL